MLIVRPATTADLDAFMNFAEQSGPGFTSLPVDRAVLGDRLAKSEKSFGQAVEGAIYTLMIEDTDNPGEPFGCAAVKTSVGFDVPFYNFRIITVGQASKVTGRRFNMRTLTMVNDYTGCTEVGTLFLLPDKRGDGAGKLLSLSRFMLMAAAPERFEETVVSELRGVVHLDGRSPFWEVVGRPFFHMDFAEADLLSATTDNQFIMDLAPKHPIYVDLLPDSARGTIGETHPDGVPARRMLEREGLRFEGVIDIFDGGPLLACKRADVRTIRKSVVLNATTGQTDNGRRMLVSNDRLEEFRCVYVAAEQHDGGLTVAPGVLTALGLNEGDPVRVRRFDV
jgi:arginine N-succinyltransferase